MKLDYWNSWRTDLEVEGIVQEWLSAPRDEGAPGNIKLSRLFFSNPERALMVIFGIIQNIKETDLMFFFAAGPLEDFLCRYGEQFIDVVHETALEQKHLRLCLAGVWKSSMNPNVWRRVEVLAEKSPKYTKGDKASGLRLD